jgi:hypothetical protein
MMKSTDTDWLMAPDLRRNRTHQLVALVMSVVSKYITNDRDDLRRKAHHDLYNAFYEAGVEVITDQTRVSMGLPPRGDLGWTRVELHAMEAKRLEAMLAPLPPIFATTQRDSTGEG